MGNTMPWPSSCAFFIGTDLSFFTEHHLRCYTRIALRLFCLLPVSAVTQAAPAHSSSSPPAIVKKHNGVMTIPLAKGRSAQYRDNMQVMGGTFVTYHYRGYVAAIHAHHIEMERMESQTYLLHHGTGKEIAIGRFFNISPNRKWLFSYDCREIHCYYNIVSWPDGKEVFFKKLPLMSGKPASQQDRAPSPIKTGTVRWQDNETLNFTQHLAESNALSDPAGQEKMMLKRKGSIWQVSAFGSDASDAADASKKEMRSDAGKSR